jgi:hypothetical protein
VEYRISKVTIVHHGFVISKNNCVKKDGCSAMIGSHERERTKMVFAAVFMKAEYRVPGTKN